MLSESLITSPSSSPLSSALLDNPPPSRTVFGALVNVTSSIASSSSRLGPFPFPSILLDSAASVVPRVLVIIASSIPSLFPSRFALSSSPPTSLDTSLLSWTMLDALVHITASMPSLRPSWQFSPPSSTVLCMSILEALFECVLVCILSSILSSWSARLGSSSIPSTLLDMATPSCIVLEALSGYGAVDIAFSTVSPSLSSSLL
ncbi:hypothetical protein JVU11DRAFT_11801 [Chiua virens]|nr:hypothetical protein JVU11DRAFT_11801 [Chiua virens]